MVVLLRGQDASITAETDPGGTSITIGILDSPEVAAPEQEVQTLRGSGSTKIQDRFKSATEVTVSGEVAEFDKDAWDTFIDYDGAADELDNSSDVQLFKISVTYTTAAGNDKVIDVENAHVDGSIPLGGARDEYVGMDLSFIGSDLTITNPA